jgi:hypothetical protein
VLLEEPVEPRNTIRLAVPITVEDDEIGLGKIDSRSQAIWPLFEPSLEPYQDRSLTGSAGSAIKTVI